MTTPADIVNRAVQLVGGQNDQKGVTGVPPTFDGSTVGVAAGTLYAGVVQTVAREWGWDFSRNVVTLVDTGNTPPLGWTYEYAYPANGIQVRQVLPAALVDPNNPLPTRWTVGNTIVTGTPTKVIWSNTPVASASFTNQPNENLWDPLFTESVVRLLASELAMAIEARPDTSQNAMDAMRGFETIGEARDS